MSSVVPSNQTWESAFRRPAANHEAGALGSDAYAEASKQYGITWLG